MEGRDRGGGGPRRSVAEVATGVTTLIHGGTRPLYTSGDDSSESSSRVRMRTVAAAAAGIYVSSLFLPLFVDAVEVGHVCGSCLPGAVVLDSV